MVSRPQSMTLQGYLDLQQQVSALGVVSGGRFIDNGDGTISDTQTGLMWEKKDDSGSIHDVDNVYTWSSTFSNPDGTLFTTFLPGVNGNIHDTATEDASQVSFAGGYSDWRIPTVVELQTILLAAFPCGSSPCVDPIFNTNCTPGCTSVALDPANACSCTAASGYGSSTSDATVPPNAWGVVFNNGNVTFGFKPLDVRVRAVRGGR